MADLPDLRPHRRSIRLPNYDYSSAGAYFVTICVEHRLCLLGHVADGAMVNNAAGEMIQRNWLALPGRFPGLELDWFQVMPNHVHAVLMLRPQDIGRHVQPTANSNSRADIPAGRGLPSVARATPTLGDIVCAFKSIVTVEYSRGVRQYRWPRFPGRLLQRDYYEHILRDEDELRGARRYIEENPLQWSFDRENPEALEVVDELPWDEV